MSNGSPRYILVDDTSSRIAYDGDAWYSTVYGNGSLFNETVHTARGYSSSFGFGFVGTDFTIWGSDDAVNGPPRGRYWQCYLDGVQLDDDESNAVPTTWVFSGVSLCGRQGISNTPHTVSFVAGPHNNSWGIGIDAIEYILPSDAPLDYAATILYPGDDPAIEYGDGWQRDSIFRSCMTQSKGSQMSFNFTGTSLTVFGYPNPLYDDLKDSVATYSVDSGIPVPFSILRSSPPTIYRAILLTDQYPQGHHTLQIMYDGDNASKPLSIQTIILASIPESALTAHHRFSAGELAGIISSGAVAAFLIIAVVVSFFSGRRRQMVSGTANKQSPI